MRVIGEKPKPRGLVWGFDDKTSELLAALFPTSRRVSDPSEVRQEEWDVLLTDQGFYGVRPRLYGIGFGCERFGTLTLEKDGVRSWYEVEFGGTSIATEFSIPSELELDLARIVERRLVPLARSRSENPVLRLRRFSSKPYTAGQRVGDFTPFLLTTEPELLAASIRRAEGSEVWCLPPGASDPVVWASLALSLWHKRDPVAFPVDPLWRDSPEWLTHEELGLVEAIQQLHEERERVLEELDDRQGRLEADLANARTRADGDERVLLTGSGDALVGSVQRALELLGFEVSNRDEVNPPTDRLEDLWVTSPDDADWIAIVEVRGYQGGASQGDLLRLVGRFAKRFLQVQGREPTRLWYLVNQFAGSDPSSRPPVLQSNPGELQTFQDEGGLAMDTASLFAVVKAVKSGEIGKTEARARLMKTIRRWD